MTDGEQDFEKITDAWLLRDSDSGRRNKKADEPFPREATRKLAKRCLYFNPYIGVRIRVLFQKYFLYNQHTIYVLH